MSEHFIKEIEIKNFKCFNDFKASGFGRVNLIGGKNNVGKSTLLEAIYINSNADNKNWFLNSIFKIAKKRDNFFMLNTADNIFVFFKTAFNIHNTLSKNYSNNMINSIITNKDKVSFNFSEKFSGTNISYIINNEEFNENILFNDFKNFITQNIFLTKENIHFLRPIGLSNYDIIKFYGNIQEIEKEEDLDISLNNFDKSLKKFKIMNDMPKVKLNDKYIPVTQLGDGSKKLINTFISIYSAKNGIILIDELDNGIHYSYLDRLWEIILIISKEQNVQVFATTHSKECIESFNRVQKELKDKDTYYFEMYRNIRLNNIEMRALDIEQLEYELTHQGRYRGE